MRDYGIKTVFTRILILVFFMSGDAHAYSYVYIQGDKVTPFYVKMEGVMMPRYGKNYCILSELMPGPIHIEILFQQNVFPPRKFTIQVPKNGYRGFLLNKHEQGFVLYDLQQKKYLDIGGELQKESENK